MKIVDRLEPPLRFDLERDYGLWYSYDMVYDDRYRQNAETTAVLMDAGIALMRQNISRRHPGETEAKIDALLSAWLCRADDLIPGDTTGSVHVRERAS